MKAEDLFPLDFLKEVKDVYVPLKSEDEIVRVHISAKTNIIGITLLILLLIGLLMGIVVFGIKLTKR